MPTAGGRGEREEIAAVEKPRPAMRWEMQTGDGRGLAEQIMRGSRRASIREKGWLGGTWGDGGVPVAVPTVATGACWERRSAVEGKAA